MKEHNILGVILAGGKSSRFGSNKSLSKLANNKLIEHVINKIDKYFSEILVISNDSNLKIENQKIKIIKDCIKGYLGPLAGVLSAMKYVNSFENKYKWIITFPCDTPFFDNVIIKKMIEKTTLPKEKIYLVKDKKQRHNIFGLWSTSLENILEEDLNNNYRKVDLWADKIGCNFIEKNIQNENEFLNINTKKDLELAEKIYKKNDFI
jgi:molybdopterin-guanine dinucleotide biosynthesis protein A|tara:strand:- start:3811 stop:4431 length:621 start_codon:yes stop_codon:yes gene_type:complete